MRNTVDATSDLSPSAPIVRARRGRVTIEISPVAVQTDAARRILGVSADILLKIPFSVLPYRRIGTHRWYLVALLQRLAERMMAEQIAYGPPNGREPFGLRIFESTRSPSPTHSESV